MALPPVSGGSHANKMLRNDACAIRGRCGTPGIVALVKVLYVGTLQGPSPATLTPRVRNK